MSESKKTPRAKVEGAPEETGIEVRRAADQRAGAADAATGEPGRPAGASASSGQGSSSGQGAADSGPGFAERVGSWVSRTFPGNENAFWGGVCGLVVALLVFAVGILRTLAVAIIVLAGVAVGQAADGDPKIINALRRFFSSNN